jgi:hypothetical protein
MVILASFDIYINLVFFIVVLLLYAENARFVNPVHTRGTQTQGLSNKLASLLPMGDWTHFTVFPAKVRSKEKLKTRGKQLMPLAPRFLLL